MKRCIYRRWRALMYRRFDPMIPMQEDTKLTLALGLLIAGVSLLTRVMCY